MGIRPGDWLYKYVTAAGLIRLLETRSVRFTQPDYLNDPYECHLTLDKRSRGHLISDFAKSLRSPPASLSIRKARERALANEDSLVDMALAHYRELRAELGILSLTDSPANLLMWSHYGDEHRGAAVGLDFCHPSLFPRAPGGDEYSGFHRVEYTSKKIAGVPRRATILQTLTTKSLAWKYEREFRLVRTLNLLRKVDDEVFVADIAPEAITHIVLGARFSHKFGAEFMSQIERQDLHHVMHSHALITPHRFGVKEVPAEKYAWMRLHRDHHFGEFAEEALSCVPMVEDEAERAPNKRGTKAKAAE